MKKIFLLLAILIAFVGLLRIFFGVFSDIITTDYELIFTMMLSLLCFLFVIYNKIKQQKVYSKQSYTIKSEHLGLSVVSIIGLCFMMFMVLLKIIQDN